jgi:hypothetical protein
MAPKKPDELHCGLAVQDHRAGFHRGRRSPPLPGRAKQHQRRFPGVDVHGHGTIPAGTDHDIGPVLVKFAWAMATAAGKSSSGRAGFRTVWPWLVKWVGFGLPGVVVWPWRKRTSMGAILASAFVNCLGGYEISVAA